MPSQNVSRILKMISAFPLVLGGFLVLAAIYRSLAGGQAAVNLTIGLLGISFGLAYLHGKIPVKSNLVLILGLILWTWGIYSILSEGVFVQRLLIYVGLFIIVVMSKQGQPIPQVRALSLDYLFVLTLGFLLLATTMNTIVGGIAPAVIYWVAAKLDPKEYPFLSTLVAPVSTILKFEFYFYCAVMLVGLGRAKDDPVVERRIPALFSSWLLLGMSIIAILRLVWTAITSNTASEAILAATAAFFCGAFLKEAYDRIFRILPTTSTVSENDSSINENMG